MLIEFYIFSFLRLDLELFPFVIAIFPLFSLLHPELLLPVCYSYFVRYYRYFTRPEISFWFRPEIKRYSFFLTLRYIFFPRIIFTFLNFKVKFKWLLSYVKFVYDGCIFNGTGFDNNSEVNFIFISPFDLFQDHFRYLGFLKKNVSRILNFWFFWEVHFSFLYSKFCYMRLSFLFLRINWIASKEWNLFLSPIIILTDVSVKHFNFLTWTFQSWCIDLFF